MSNERTNILIGAGQLLLAILLFFGLDATRLRSLALPATTQSNLVLVLLVGGLAFSGYGFYRTFKRKDSIGKFGVGTKLESVTNAEFRNQHVVVDGKEFTACRFYNVTLVYNGEAPMALFHCTFSGTIMIQADKPEFMHLLGLLKGVGFLRPGVPIYGPKHLTSDIQEPTITRSKPPAQNEPSP